MSLTARKDLSRTHTTVATWRETVDDRAPRLGPGEVIGATTTRVGRFRDVDPLRTPRLWSRWRWLALVAWAGLLGGSGWRAWRTHGGLPDRDDGRS